MITKEQALQAIINIQKHPYEDDDCADILMVRQYLSQPDPTAEFRKRVEDKLAEYERYAGPKNVVGGRSVGRTARRIADVLTDLLKEKL